MIINITIFFLTIAFLVSSYFQNSLYSTSMHWEKRWKITHWLSLISSLILVIISYLLSRQTESLFDRQWIDLCMLYYIIGLVAIQLPFFVWGRWSMNKYHEANKRGIAS